LRRDCGSNRARADCASLRERDSLFAGAMKHSFQIREESESALTSALTTRSDGKKC
jgi:hypothetical protein